jgi:hypothetical protein
MDRNSLLSVFADFDASRRSRNYLLARLSSLFLTYETSRIAALFANA